MFRPRVALASLSGQADASWAATGASHAGVAFLGGIALDEAARRGARQLVARGREEFLPQAPLTWIEEQFRALESVAIQPAVNVRSTTRASIADAAAVCERHDAILEINAHCRQPELCAVGCGESLLRDTDRLCWFVRAAREEGATVSVKVRTEVDGVDLPTLAAALGEAGAQYIHVDAMDSERRIAAIVEATDSVVIANNGVRDRETVYEYLEYGAAAVSVGRPSDDLDVLKCVRTSTAEWFDRQPLHA